MCYSLYLILLTICNRKTYFNCLSSANLLSRVYGSVRINCVLVAGRMSPVARKGKETYLSNEKEKCSSEHFCLISNIYSEGQKNSIYKKIIYLLGQVCVFSLPMVYVYANLWKYILLFTNENILLGSQVQKDKYQIWVAKLPTILQTDIKDNPWLSSFIFKIKINFQVYCIV